MANKNGIVKLGALALGAGLVLNELTKGNTNRSANIGSSLKGAIDTTDAAELVKVIDSSKVLQEYLKRLTQTVTGEKGKDGKDGVNGVNGQNGIDGESQRNYDYGLFKNSALEKFSLENFVTNAGVRLDLIDKINGLPSVELSNSNSMFTLDGIKKELISRTKLTKITFWAKKVTGDTVNVSVRIRTFDENEVVNNYSRGDINSVYGNMNNISNNWTKFTNFVFANGTENYSVERNLHAKAITGNIRVFVLNLNSSAKFSNIVAETVPLGEPVPSNLPWLPQGQMVYDITTWEVGIYNGTTIVWFAA